MGLAEDSRKVERIVAGSAAEFARLYTPLLQVREEWRRRRADGVRPNEARSSWARA
jgi:hypothetical protein